ALFRRTAACRRRPVVRQARRSAGLPLDVTDCFLVFASQGAGAMTDSRRHIVVAGAGVAGLETALALHALAHEYVTVELLAPEQEFSYRPLAVAEPFQAGEVRRFPLDRLVHAAGAELRNGTLFGVDADAKQALLADDQSVAYDALVLALGG